MIKQWAPPLPQQAFVGNRTPTAVGSTVLSELAQIGPSLLPNQYFQSGFTITRSKNTIFNTIFEQLWAQIGSKSDQKCAQTTYFIAFQRLTKKHDFHAVFEHAQKSAILPCRMPKRIPKLSKNYLWRSKKWAAQLPQQECSLVKKHVSSTILAGSKIIGFVTSKLFFDPKMDPE